MEPNNSPQESDPTQPVQQSDVQQIPRQKGFLLPIIAVVLLILVVGTGAYYLGTQRDSSSSIENTQVNNQQTQPSAPSTNNETLPTTNPTTNSDQTGQKLNPTVKSVTIPSDWKSYTATDPDFGVKTTMSMPPGYSFRFTGSEFTMQNDSDATELWDYSTSVFRGRDGLKNYYAGQSRRAWYQDLLDGDFMEEKPASFNPGKITNAVEHQIGSKTYYEMTVSGGPPANYSGEVGKHFVYVQNGIVHILKPASHKANTAEAKIPQNIETILASLSSSQVK